MFSTSPSPPYPAPLLCRCCYLHPSFCLFPRPNRIFEGQGALKKQMLVYWSKLFQLIPLSYVYYFKSNCGVNVLHYITYSIHVNGTSWHNLFT